MTRKIIINSIDMLFINFKANMQILLPYTLLSFISDFIIKWDVVTIVKFDIFDLVMLLLFYYVTVDAIVKIHRFNILGDTNFFEYGIVRNFKYFIGSLIYIILFYLCLIPLIFGSALGNSGNSLSIFFGFTLSIVLIIYILPYVLVLPIIATDNKLRLREFIKNLKGFRLTLILQFLFLIIIYIIVFMILLLVTGIDVMIYYSSNYESESIYGEIFLFIFVIFTFAYAVNLLTETFRFWNEKYNFYNF